MTWRAAVPPAPVWQFPQANMRNSQPASQRKKKKQRQEVIDRVNLAKLNKPISNLALKRWFSDDYLLKNPNIRKDFMKILNKSSDDQKKLY